MASEKTRIILLNYTNSDYKTLFKENFPVSKLDDVIEVIDVCLEIKDLTFDPSLNCEAKTKMKQIARELAIYLCNEISSSRCDSVSGYDLLSEFRTNWENLSGEQKDVIWTINSRPDESFIDAICKKPYDQNLDRRDFLKGKRNVIIWY
jgi:hypothetical protein